MDGGRWDATVRIRRLFTEENARVERVTCRKMTADLAELRAAIYSPPVGGCLRAGASVSVVTVPSTVPKPTGTPPETTPRHRTREAKTPQEVCVFLREFSLPGAFEVREAHRVPRRFGVVSSATNRGSPVGSSPCRLAPEKRMGALLQVFAPGCSLIARGPLRFVLGERPPFSGAGLPGHLPVPSYVLNRGLGRWRSGARSGLHRTEMSRLSRRGWKWIGPE